jgi:hypothetical protein
MRVMKLRTLALVLLAFFPVLAFAQTVPGTATYEWKLPTTACTIGVNPCDKVAPKDPLTAVEVYIATSPIPDNSTSVPTLTLGAGATTTTYSTTLANGSTLYARFRAVNANGKSALSEQVSKLITLPTVPDVPTSITVTIRVTP